MKKKAAMEAERLFALPLNKESDKQEGNEWNLSAALQLIGIDKAAFADHVRVGNSFADIASAYGVTRQQLIDALLSDMNAKIDEVKGNGDITQEQADQKRQAAQKEVEAFIDHTQTMFDMKEKKAKIGKK